MQNIMIKTNQNQGMVTFENFDEVKNNLKVYLQENFAGKDYEKEGLDNARADQAELDALKKRISKERTALKAPYTDVDKKLEELAKIIDVPFKKADSFVADIENSDKYARMMEYAKEQAEEFGEIGRRIIESPVFFNSKWKNKGYVAVKYQKDICDKLQKSVKDIQTIQATGSVNTQAMLARYFDTLSLDGMDRFVDALSENNETVDSTNLKSENNVLGYKVLKITATEDQMSAIMDMLKLMGVETEEVEDGMPKPMDELTNPSFDSFVAFDIETTGTLGAEKGDEEPKITEIGAVRVENGVVVDHFDMLANPGRKIVPMVARMTHITDEMVADQPPVDEVIRKFHEFVGDSILVGHNIKSSDLRYITKAADKAGVHFGGAFLDTYRLAQNFKKAQEWTSLKLGYLAEEFELDHQEVHRAWSDAEVNASVYFELQKLNKIA